MQKLAPFLSIGQIGDIILDLHLACVDFLFIYNYIYDIYVVKLINLFLKIINLFIYLFIHLFIHHVIYLSIDLFK